METLLAGITSITIGQIAMMLIGAVLIYLGIKKEYEPTLLVPMGLGTILVNFPGTGVLTQMVNGSESEGVLDVLFKAGISTELFPLLIFIGIGAMIVFRAAVAKSIHVIIRCSRSIRYLLYDRSRYLLRIRYQRSCFNRYHRCR